ncbi:hypothetical protein BDQ17DRAFT_1434182 [Cyathus striatus]|nr:hypothetical protein BDQ17DRAFT_1434182 [Cyathus striatus]
MHIALPAILLLLPDMVLAGAGAGGLYLPGLVSLINRANILLSTGQFNEAAKLYSKAICLSLPPSSLRYRTHIGLGWPYWRIMTKSSLISQTFDSAHLSKTLIHLKEGDFPASRISLARYIKAKGRDADAMELEKDLHMTNTFLTTINNSPHAPLPTLLLPPPSLAILALRPQTMSAL